MEHDMKPEVILNNILTRKSVRKFEKRSVEDDKIELMLKAAMAAPSACNKQPWRFIVIKERRTLDAIGNVADAYFMAKQAPLAIAVCGDKEAFLPNEAEAYWTQDLAAATENLLLEAHALGLGAVWCGVYPISERVKAVKELLEIPEGVTPMNVVMIGYPDDDHKPLNKWHNEYVHFEKW